MVTHDITHDGLQVEDPKNPNIIFHRTPDPATFPRPPVMLRVVDRETTAVTLSWRKVTIYIYIYTISTLYLHCIYTELLLGPL